MNPVLLVNPAETWKMRASNPPLGLLYIAANLEANGIGVDVIDGFISGDKAIYDALGKKYPFVGVTCLTPARHSSIDILRRAKEAGSTTVIGGVHPTVMKKQMEGAYPFIDHVVAGDGEQKMVDIVHGLDTLSERVLDLDMLPSPAWHKVDLAAYPAKDRFRFNLGSLSKLASQSIPKIAVEFSRGCSCRCTFCSAWWVKGKYRVRDPLKMADELQELVERYGIHQIGFADDDFATDREKVMKLCQEIIDRKLNIAWIATTRTDNIDEEIAEKMKEAGCYYVSFGIETGDPYTLQHIHKNVTIETAENAIRICRKAGMFVNALVIVGNFGETIETVTATRNFLRRARPSTVSAAGGLWILPGTADYQRALREGFITEDFWLTKTPYLVYTKENSLETLEKFQDIIYSYSKWVWFRRQVGKLTRRLQKWLNLRRNRP